jgi:hypothetical protein
MFGWGWLALHRQGGDVSNKAEKLKSQAGSSRVTWAHAFRDIVIASMNKGQLPLLAVAGLLALAIWRMTPQAVEALLNRVLARMETGELMGWAIALLLLAGWYTHARWMRKQASGELDRIGREKSKLQEGAAGRKLQGSRSRS